MMPIAYIFVPCTKTMANNNKHIELNPETKDRKAVLLSDYFPKAIFWDVDIDQFDYREDADFIIPRVLDWGTF
jgi:hypothetical protein